MSKLPAFLSAFDKLLTGHPICFTNSLLVVLSAGGERLFQSVAFKCPSDPDLAPWYGSLFLIAPLLVLLISGIVLNESLWRVYHGCRKRSDEARLTNGHRCHTFCITFFRSLIVPSAWLFVSLLDGQYIVCILAERPDEETIETVRIKTFSQIAGWVYLVVAVILGTAVTCYIRCWDKQTYLELRYAEIYRKLEREVLEKEMNENAKKIATQNVHSLFTEKLPPKEIWDKITVPVDSKEETDSVPKVAYYSSLHKWSNQGTGNRESTTQADDSTKKDNANSAQQTNDSTKKDSADSTL